MKALFITTHTNDVDSLVRAWDCWNEVKATRIIFNYRGPIDNTAILEQAKEANPDVIFYIGAALITGAPTPETLIELRDIAPSINMCCDAGDWPWHPILDIYRDRKCFDLQVTLDGCKNAPVDHVTITPVDPGPWIGNDPPRTIFCGFSGNYGGTNPRMQILPMLINQGHIILRCRNKHGDYEGHAAFVRSCRMIINTSYCGSGEAHHVKGRVLESALAGCALLEGAWAPTKDWIPEELFYTYKGRKQAERIIDSLTVEDVTEKGEALREYVKDRYHPREIYGAILKEIGLVDTSIKTSAA